MPTFILAGVQRSIAARVGDVLREQAGQFAGWTSEVFPGRVNNLHDIGSSQVDALLRLAEKHDGAHIFGVSVVKTRKEVESLVSPHFRFRWLDAAPFGPVNRGDAAAMMNMLVSATVEEDYWLAHVKPKDTASPLALPDIFSCQRSLLDIWRLAQSYNNLGHLETAARLIARFISAHRRRIDGFKNTPWHADDDWIWDDDGERHGTPAFPEDWKFSLRLPDGFHFDVSPHTKGKLFFADRAGIRHSFKTHLNVTAHGHVRGAARGHP